MFSFNHLPSAFLYPRSAQPLAHSPNPACGVMASDPQDSPWIGKFGSSRGVGAINTATHCSCQIPKPTSPSLHVARLGPGCLLPAGLGHAPSPCMAMLGLSHASFSPLCQISLSHIPSLCAPGWELAVPPCPLHDQIGPTC